MLLTPISIFAARGVVDGPNEIAPDRYVYYPGTDQPGVPDPMSDFIKNGEWVPAFKAQNKLLDEHAERYDLQEQDWRKKKPWYEPEKN